MLCEPPFGLNIFGFISNLLFTGPQKTSGTDSDLDSVHKSCVLAGLACYMAWSPPPCLALELACAPLQKTAGITGSAHLPCFTQDALGTCVGLQGIDSSVPALAQATLSTPIRALVLCHLHLQGVWPQCTPT